MSISQMSGRERILAALHSKEVDRLPWAPLIDPYFINSLPQQGLDYDFIQACTYIGNDIIERHVCGPTATYQNVTQRREENGNIMREYFDTPVGSVFVEHTKTGETSYVSKHMVESVEDMKIFSYICENTIYTPNIDAFIQRDKEIGDRGIASLSGPMSPVQEMLQFISGVENTVYLLMDYPDEMEALFDTMHQRNKKQYDLLLEYPCDYIFDYEDTSTTVMSRTMFQDYSLPAINDYSDMVHQHNKTFITHMCGKLTGFVDLIAKGRQDGIDSVCPPQTGDLYPWNAREAWGKEKVVIGGIDPPSLVSMTKEQTLQTVLDVIQNVKNKHGFILSTGDAVPFGAPIEHLKAISQLIALLGPKSMGCEIDPEVIKQI